MKLPATLDTAQAPSLHEALLGLEGAGPVVDAGEVRQLGQACLQVLLAHRRDRGLLVCNPSEAFDEQWQLAGGPALTSLEMNS